MEPEVVEYDAVIRACGGPSFHISAQANVDRPRSHGWIDTSPAACLAYMDTRIMPSYYGKPGRARRILYPPVV